MKNLLKTIGIPLALVVVAIWFTSCNDEESYPTTDIQVLFTASLDNVQSRAYGDGSKVNTLTVGVYNEDKTLLLQKQELPVSGTEIDVELNLAQEQRYNIVFWAQNNTCKNYDTSDLKAITMDTSDMPTTLDDAELMDAFYGSVQNILIKKDMPRQNVRLTRPLAQINIGTTGKACPATFSITAAETFDPFSGNTSGSKEHKWIFTETTDKTFSIEGKTYTYLAMGYLFAPKVSITTDGYLTIVQDDGTPRRITIPKVALQANHKTNIAGLFTE